jgi:hypothetical protein
VNIQDKVKTPAFHLLLFSGNKNQEKIEAIRNTAGQYKNVIQVEVIPSGPATKGLYKSFGVQSGGYYFVRPDMYIAIGATGLMNNT